MSRYIDADELRSFIKGQYFKCDMPEEWGNGVMWATSQINRYCNKVAPSIDIVRCKECRWATETRMKSIEGSVIYLKTCPSRTEVIDDDDFCSYGEREGE